MITEIFNHLIPTLLFLLIPYRCTILILSRKSEGKCNNSNRNDKQIHQKFIWRWCTVFCFCFLLKYLFHFDIFCVDWFYKIQAKKSITNIDLWTCFFFWICTITMILSFKGLIALHIPRDVLLCYNTSLYICYAQKFLPYNFVKKLV